MMKKIKLKSLVIPRKNGQNKNVRDGVKTLEFRTETFIARSLILAPHMRFKQHTLWIRLRANFADRAHKMTFFSGEIGSCIVASSSETFSFALRNRLAFVDESSVADPEK